MKFILTTLLFAGLCASAQVPSPAASSAPPPPLASPASSSSPAPKSPVVSAAGPSLPTPNSSLSTPPSPDAPSTNRPPIVVAPGREGARQAQAWLKRGKPGEAAEAFLSAARGADVEEADVYRYNAAYAYCQAKEPDKAAETLRPLLASKAVGARAGELLGKLRLEQAREKGAEDPAAKAEALEEAAASFQRALRDAPADERRNRNFTRAVSPLAEARESAHIARVLKEHGQTPPDQLMGAMLSEQRALLEEAYGVFTNDAPARIAKAEALAKRQEKQADLWIPLKQHMMQAVTNQQQQAQAAQQIELARDSMRGTAEAFQDLLPEAAAEAAQVEPLVYAFWKAVALPPAAIDEDILCQSNALTRLPARHFENRETQPEALQLTQLFRQRLPEWADQYRQQAQADTNLPPFTAEDQAKVEEIAAHTEKLQREIVETSPSEQSRRALQTQALKNLLEIRDLLPKQKSQGQSQQQQQQQQQQPNQQNQQQQEQQQQEQKEQQPEPDEQKKEPPPQDVQELLRRALDREKEHENEKKKQLRNIPMSPSERDW